MVVLGVTSNARSDSSPSYGLAMAEGVGFEPTVRLPVQQFSSPPYSIRSHSTASAHMQAPLGNREAEYTSGRQQVISERH